MTLEDVLAAARQLHQTHPDLAAFAAWPDDLTPTGLQPATIPATDLVCDFNLDGGASTRDLVTAIRATAHLVQWKQTYTEEEVGADSLTKKAIKGRFGPRALSHPPGSRATGGNWGAVRTLAWHRIQAAGRS